MCIIHVLFNMFNCFGAFLQISSVLCRSTGPGSGPNHVWQSFWRQKVAGENRGRIASEGRDLLDESPWQLETSLTYVAEARTKTLPPLT